ncbi:hypothetical protein NQ314_016312 [Rhamnusium bicolor]|uniref:Fibronectin type-III domain-containing protein n=1 Tax=Rhamnusium bicolor TaxID=1586634 RepID=A0AAV8WXF5_9CUCU|nr:hypothetical protein NQ314_016312 [Rhamnusium bicolor]
MDMATGKWVRVGRVPGDKLSPDGKGEFEVTGLTPGAEYKFRVTAVNNEGDSEPLVSDRPIVAKNPFGIVFIVTVLKKKYMYLLFNLQMNLANLELQKLLITIIKASILNGLPR